MKKQKDTRLSLFFFVLFVVFLSSTVLLAQQENNDIVIGKTITFKSKILDRDLNLSIYLPDSYNRGSSSYPVLYDLNAFACFKYDCGTVELLARTSTMPEMIVVGFPGIQNGYVPTAFEERGENPTAADLTIKFLKEELIPYINKNYRTNNFSVLYGHSVAGLFTAYTLFTNPDLFTAYIASSPWFQVNDQYWLKNINKIAKGKKLDNKLLFMTVGKKEDQLTINTYKELEQWMSNQSFRDFKWQSAYVEGDHGSMIGRSIYDGMFFIFEDWKIPENIIRNADTNEIDRYLKESLKRWSEYGFNHSDILPQNNLNSFGYYLLNANEYDKAIGILAYNLSLYPESFNAHDSLAEAYMKKGDKENAIKYYKLAVEKNPGDTDFAKRVLQSSKEKLHELGVE